eukprot:gene17136-23589_t
MLREMNIPVLVRTVTVVFFFASWQTNFAFTFVKHNSFIKSNNKYRQNNNGDELYNYNDGPSKSSMLKMEKEKSISWKNIVVTNIPTSNDNNNIKTNYILSNDYLLPKNTNNENSDQLSSLTHSKADIIYNEDDLEAKWVEFCIKENKPLGDMDNFNLYELLPYLINDPSNHNKLIQIVNKTYEKIDQSSLKKNDNIIYITENELVSVWEFDKVNNPMGKPMEQFNIKDALLLLHDEDFSELMKDFELGSVNNDVIENKEIKLKNKEIVIDNNEPELFITIQELERIWNERANIKWGLPSPSFDIKNALLLLDDEDLDDIEDENIVYVQNGFDDPNEVEESNNELWSNLEL